MTVKQLDHVSVWIDERLLRDVDLAPESGDHNAFMEVFTSPRNIGSSQRLPHSHPLACDASVDESTSLAPPGMHFRAISPSIVAHEGAAATLRLLDLGFIVIYSKYHKGPYIDSEFNELQPLIFKFAASLEGCLDHQRLRREIIARKRAETAVRHREEHFRSLIENALDVILIINYDGSISFASPSVKRVLGFEPEDLRNKNLFSLVHPKEATEFFRSFQREVMAPGIGSSFQFRIGHNDGGWRTVSAATNNLLSTPSVGGIIMNLNDVTERNRMREALRRSEERYSLAARGASDGIWDWNLKTNEIYLSPRWKEMLGFAEDEIGNTPEEWFDLILPQDLPGLKLALDTCQEGENELFQHEYRIRHKDGSIRWMLTRGVAMLGPDCMPYRMAGSQTDVTEMRRHTAELDEARLRAVEASQAKGEFLANMSHEIRTPMNGVIGMASLLLERMGNSENREYVQTIKTSGEVLLGVVNDILDFSKIESGKLEMEDAPFDLIACVEGVLDVVGPLAAESGVSLGSWIDQTTPKSPLGDGTRIRQVLLNLVGNAVKFTPKGSVVVTVSGYPLPGDAVEICFSVEDTGIGISAEKISDLFEPFSQADASTTRRYGGTGLGLAISRRLTELMGGRIWVKSSEGKGSTFSFTVVGRCGETATNVVEAHGLHGRRLLIVGSAPLVARVLIRQTGVWNMIADTAENIKNALSKHQSEAYDAALIDASLISESESQTEILGKDIPLILMAPIGTPSLYVNNDEWTDHLTMPVKRNQLLRVLNRTIGNAVESEIVEAKTPKIESEFQATEMKILLAEDNPVNQKVAQLMLQRLGYKADLVTNGKEVIEALRKTNYDLILMDIQMPEMDGLEATRCIRESLNTEQPFIAAMTAHAMTEDRLRCLDAGMNAYIAKPIAIDKLRDAIIKASAAAGYEAPANLEQEESNAPTDSEQTKN